MSCFVGLVFYYGIYYNPCTIQAMQTFEYTDGGQYCKIFYISGDTGYGGGSCEGLQEEINKIMEDEND